MLKSFKYRLYPTKSQKELLNKHFGASRFVYNLSLECKQLAYKNQKKNLSHFELNKQLPDLKEECPWLKEVCSRTLQLSIKNLLSAYENYFRIIKKNPEIKKINPEYGFPKFKSKWNEQQSYTTDSYIKIINTRKIKLPKFKEGIKVIIDRNPVGKIKSATVSRTLTGKYFISLLCETFVLIPEKFLIKEETTVGIDLGLKNFMTSSEREIIENPKWYRKQELKLKRIQRKYSKYKGKKAKKKLTLIHEKISNQRKDFLHKTSTKIVEENHSIAIEDLNVKGMLQNHCLAKSISDVGWGMFRIMLEYKSEWYGRNLIKVDRFFPSSKTCSNCGNIYQDLKLNKRSWVCDKCGIEHDRDFNAAINIKQFALRSCMGDTAKSIRSLPSTEEVSINATEFP